MKKILLFVGICCASAHFSYGQSPTPSLKEPVSMAVSSHPELSAQLSKLDAKQAEINQAVTSSRAQANKLNNELRVLKEEYVRLLKVEMEKTTNEQLKAQLLEEMSRYSETTNSQTR